jgi:FMN phosphatase YigB (HAD superfamily)
MDTHFFKGFTQDLHSASLWDTFYAQARTRDPSLPATTPPLPRIDGEQLFWSMMTAARHPDPWMFPALKKLRASGRYILAALSNTVIYPSDHPLATAHDDVRAVFDLFISSAHVGMRKPEPRIYDLALRELDRFARENVGRDDRDTRGWERGVSAEEVVFLDDIGENLKAAKTRGFRTIKVHLGRAFEAVDQLEELTGLKLAGDHPRIAVMPKTNAKL